MTNYDSGTLLIIAGCIFMLLTVVTKIAKGMMNRISTSERKVLVYIYEVMYERGQAPLYWEVVDAVNKNAFGLVFAEGMVYVYNGEIRLTEKGTKLAKHFKEKGGYSVRTIRK